MLLIAIIFTEFLMICKIYYCYSELCGVEMVKEDLK